MSNLDELKRKLASSAALHKRMIFHVCARVGISPMGMGYIQIFLGSFGLTLMLLGTIPQWAVGVAAALFFLTVTLNGLSYTALASLGSSGLSAALKNTVDHSELESQMQAISVKYRDMFYEFCKDAGVEPDSPTATREIHRLSGLMKAEIEALPGIAGAQVEIITPPSSKTDLH